MRERKSLDNKVRNAQDDEKELVEMRKKTRVHNKYISHDWKRCTRDALCCTQSMHFALVHVTKWNIHFCLTELGYVMSTALSYIFAPGSKKMVRV